MSRRIIHKASHTSTPSGIKHASKAYRDSESEEWYVDFFIDGKRLDGARYFALDKNDAIDTVDTHIRIITKDFP